MLGFFVNLGKKKILIVEDDEATREIMSEIVSQLGMEVFAFEDPVQSLQSLKQHQFDLALLDIMLPTMDGYELLREIRLHPKHEKLPVIFVTAKDLETEAIEGYKSGADYYIRKPFTKEQLEQGIRLYL